jgi:hypothetical protein
MRASAILLIALFAFSGIWQPIMVSHAAQPTIKQVTPSADTLGNYEKFELTIDLEATFKNPYDPEDIKLDGQFTSPSGRAVSVAGFYYHDFDFQIVKSDGVPKSQTLTDNQKRAWKVRFTPDEVGSWTYNIQVTASGETVRSEPQKFTVNKSDRRGFLQVGKRDFRYLEFSDGSPFFGIGLNMGWYNEGRLGDYQRWLNAFSEAGGNLIRVWLAPWGFSPEWSDTPLGNYEKRQDRAFELDKLFEMAEQHGVYIQLALLNHGQFNTQTNPEWDANPYNAKNGGPLQKPEEFATNVQAIKLWKQRLRYIAARWGYSTHLMAWEWWNEVNWTPLQNPEILAPWIIDSAAYLSTVDPYKHMITHSGSGLDHTKVWGDPSISITQVHIYEAKDWAFNTVDIARKWIKQYQKPYLMGEFGYADVPKTDPMGIRLHIGIWSGVMSGAMGTGQFWWWDSYIEADQRYQPFKAVAAFVAGEDFAAHNFQPATAKASKTSLTDVYGLQSSDYALLWVISGKYNDDGYRRLIVKNLSDRVPNPNDVSFPEVAGLQLTIKGMSDGQYSLTWWDTHAGKPIKTDNAASNDGALVVEIPTFQTDMALKVQKAQ